MNLTRRHLLRGTTAGFGIALGLPILEAMLDTHGEALANGDELPRRIGVFFWGNGVVTGDWAPSQAGPGWQPSPSLGPLAEADIREDVAILSGLGFPNVPYGHGTGRGAMLSGSYDGTLEGATGLSAATLPSFDQIAADHIAAGTQHRSIEIAISTAGIGGTEDRYSCAWQNNSVLPAEASPAALFERLFLGFEPDTSLRDSRLSVLDAIVADANRLQAKLGAADQARLEAHLEGLRALEVRIEAEPPDCQPPASPVDPAEAGPEPLAERNQLMADLVAAALACDLTRVFSIRFTQSIGETLFNDVGATEGIHSLSHGNAAMHTATVASTMERFADLVRTLGATPEGDGRLLDRCAIMATSDLGDGNTHSLASMPIVVAGQAGGALKTGFHHQEVGGALGSAVALTMLQAVGAPVASLGTDAALADAPLPAILA